MNKETKQLNWFLAIIVLGSFAYACVDTIPDGIVQPPIQIDTSNMPATQKVVSILIDMSESCDIKDELREAIVDGVLSHSDALQLGDLCVTRAEAEALKESPHALDIQRNRYNNRGGLSM